MQNNSGNEGEGYGIAPPPAARFGCPLIPRCGKVPTCLRNAWYPGRREQKGGSDHDQVLPEIQKV